MQRRRRDSRVERRFSTETERGGEREMNENGGGHSRVLIIRVERDSHREYIEGLSEVLQDPQEIAMRAVASG